MNDHERYGVQTMCSECWSATIVAKSHTVSAAELSQVQAVCTKVDCHWKGEPIFIVDGKPVQAM